jgi:hypothetical protein
MAVTVTSSRSSGQLYPGLHCPPRWGTPRDPDRATFGPAIGAVASSLATPLMPHQQYVADVSHELDPDTGELAYDEVILVGPRQAWGKTTLMLPVMVHRAVGELAAGLPQRILYMAQTSDEAKKKWRDHHLVALLNSPYRHLFRSRERLNFEAIMWGNGSMHSPVATTGKTGGTGDAVDLGVLDEAWVHESTVAEQAMRPTMMTRRSPQLWIVSMVPGPERAKKMDGSRSSFLRSKLRRAVEALDAGQRTGTAVFFWAAARGADPADRGTWLSALPALCPVSPRPPCRCDPAGRWAHTVFESAIYRDQQKMARLDFAAEYLSWWPDEAAREWQMFSEQEWDQVARPGMVASPPVSFAAYVANDRSWAAIGVAGRCESGRLVEVTGDRHGIDHRPGASWVLGRLRDLEATQIKDGYPPVAMVSNDRALADAAADVGLHLHRVSAPDEAAAAATLYDGVRARSVRHLGQRVLTGAVRCSVRVGQGRGFLIGSSDPEVDVCPAPAAALALWALATPRVHRKREAAQGRPRMRWM